VCWCPLRIVFDSSVEVLKLVIPEFTDDIPEKYDARMF
jgi:hypothetical protein